MRIDSISIYSTITISILLLYHMYNSVIRGSDQLIMVMFIYGFWK